MRIVISPLFKKISFNRYKWFNYPHCFPSTFGKSRKGEVITGQSTKAQLSTVKYSCNNVWCLLKLALCCVLFSGLISLDYWQMPRVCLYIRTFTHTHNTYTCTGAVNSPQLPVSPLLKSIQGLNKCKDLITSHIWKNLNMRVDLLKKLFAWLSTPYQEPERARRLDHCWQFFNSSEIDVLPINS